MTKASSVFQISENADLSETERLETKAAAPAVFYAAELVVLAFILLSIILYQIADVPYRSPLTLYVARLKHSLAFYLLGLGLSIFLVRLSDLKTQIRSKRQIPLKKSLSNYRESFFCLSRIFHDLRLFNAIALMFVGYIHLKHLIPFVNNNFLDAALIEQERLIFGGEIAATKLHSLLGVGAAPFLSDLYKFFYPFVAFSIVFFIVQRDKKLAQDYCLAFVLTWFLGILTVYLFPTLGPCFFEPELFKALPQTEVTEMQEKLWRHKLFMDQFPKDPRPVYLISGLPSLHLAVPLLTSIFLGRRFPVLALGCWLFVGLTFITTIYFGWHYLIDDVASVILVAVVLLLVKQLRGSDVTS